MLVAIISTAAYMLAGSSDRVVAMLIAPLKDRFDRPSLSVKKPLAGIIALGGGRARTIEAIRLAHRFPGAKLVITGAADFDYDLARAQGFSTDRLKLELKATNTFQNALFSKRLLAPKPRERWLLVTSATHMPRAIGSFRAHGFQIEPWPIYDIRSSDHQAFAVAQHEWLGLLSYRLLGRTDAWFPGPLN